jgi:glutaconate CoA-transferase subunit B
LNSTVIGDYGDPKVRLPGAGGAPEIASLAKETLITIKHSPRTLVERVDFITSAGYLNGGNAREKAGLKGGPTALITDLGVLVPEEDTRELVVAQLHPGVTKVKIQEETGWDIRFLDSVSEIEPPSGLELTVLRDLLARTEAARAIKT